MAGRKPGGPKTGGRQKGSLNKRTLEARDWAVANGFAPTLGLEFCARVLRSAMAPAPGAKPPSDEDSDQLEYSADAAEQFYHGKIIRGIGEGASVVEENWGRATIEQGIKAAAEYTAYMYGKRSALRIDFKKPHDMTQDELDAAIRAAFGEAKDA